ncbi:MAG: hypothetical protein IPO21_20685 [Bacteroidales bacterium]|nr:hypothetical protein [Bacteroidales bacterium]
MPGTTTTLDAGWTTYTYIFTWTGGVSGTGNTVTAGVGTYSVSIKYGGTNRPCPSTSCPNAIDTIVVEEMKMDITDGKGTWCGDSVTFKIGNAPGVYAIYKNQTGGSEIGIINKHVPVNIAQEKFISSLFTKNAGTLEAWVEIRGEEAFDFGFGTIPTGTVTAIAADETLQLIEAKNSIHFGGTSIRFETEYLGPGASKTYDFQLGVFSVNNNPQGEPAIVGSQLHAGPVVSVTIDGPWDANLAANKWVTVDLPADYKMVAGNYYYIGLISGDRPIAYYSAALLPKNDNLDGKQATLAYSNNYGNLDKTMKLGSFYNHKFATSIPWNCGRFKITATESCPCSPPKDMTISDTVINACITEDVSISIDATLGIPQNGSYNLKIKGPGQTGTYTTITSASLPYSFNLTNVDNADIGIYTFIIEDGKVGSVSCSDSVSFRLTVATPPTPAPADVTICEGEDLEITSGITAPPTGTIYHWTGPGAFTAATADVTRAKALTTYSGTYSLYTEIAGCVSTTVSADVLVNPSPVTTWLTTDTTYCGTAGVTLSVNAVAGATYVWTKNGAPITTATTASLSGALAGVYGLTLTKSGCSYTLRNITVVGNPTPVYTITGGDDYCAGETVAPVVIEFTVGSPNFSFTYTIDGTAKAVSNHTSTTYTINTPDAGIYRLTGTITDGNGCTALATTANTVVEINPLPVVTMKAVSYCSTTDNINLYNEMISSEPTNGSGVFTASAGTITGTGSGSIFTHGGVAGIYTITYTFTDDNGCSDSFSETLTINANLSPTITANPGFTVCQKTPITLATSQAFAKYTWTGTAAALLGSATTIASPTIPATAAPGIYAITVTVEDANKCTGTDTKTITIHALPTATLSPVAPLCVGDAPATITATTSVADGVGTWTGAFGFLKRLQHSPLQQTGLSR